MQLSDKKKKTKALKILQLSNIKRDKKEIERERKA